MINEIINNPHLDKDQKTFFMISASEHGVPMETLGLFGLGQHIGDYTLVVFDEPGVLLHNEHFKQAQQGLESTLSMMQDRYGAVADVIRGSEIMPLGGYETKFKDIQKAQKANGTKTIRSGLPEMVKYELAVMAELADNGFEQKLGIPVEQRHDELYTRGRDDLNIVYTPNGMNMHGSEVSPYIVDKPSESPNAFVAVPRILLTDDIGTNLKIAYSATDKALEHYHEIANLAIEMQGQKPEKSYSHRDMVDKIAVVLSDLKGEHNPRDMPIYTAR